MDRLTRRVPGGYGGKEGYELNSLQGCKAVIDRLAAYENTGLSPEEILSLKEHAPALKSGDHVWINGILGCCMYEEHVITKVNLHESSAVKNIWYTAELVCEDGGGHCSFEESDIGKFVFLTQEEARQKGQGEE